MLYLACMQMFTEYLFYLLLCWFYVYIYIYISLFHNHNRYVFDPDPSKIRLQTTKMSSAFSLLSLSSAWAKRSSQEVMKNWATSSAKSIQKPLFVSWHCHHLLWWSVKNASKDNQLSGTHFWDLSKSIQLFQPKKRPDPHLHPPNLSRWCSGRMWIEIPDEITVVEIRDESPSDSSFMTHFILNSDGLVECHFFFAFLLSVVDSQKWCSKTPMFWNGQLIIGLYRTDSKGLDWSAKKSSPWED